MSELQCFCRRHEEGDRALAAAGLLEQLRQDWGDVPIVDLPAISAQDRDAEDLALVIIGDVGDVARILLAEDGLAARLGWARANLIADLDRYASAIEMPV